MVYGTDYGTQADNTVLTMAMIETQAGLENLDAILEIKELDGIFVGPSDLNQSLGHGAKLDSLEPEFLEILQDIVVRTRAAGKQAGLFCGSAEYAVQMRQFGYRFLVLSSDSRLLAAASRGALEVFRAGSSLKAGGY